MVATEVSSVGSRERPDVVGFRSTCSAIIEAKISRTDFLADSRKPERLIAGTGIGVYRFYLCPKDVIKVSELPEKWGLLYLMGTTIDEIVRPKGNGWPGSFTEGWGEFQHEPDIKKERAILFSIARRLANGKICT